MRPALLILFLLVGCSGPSNEEDLSEGKAQEVGAVEKAGGLGPFGIDAGMKLADLNVEGDTDSETGLSILKSAPKPSTQFPGVAVVSYPETGACEVRALSSVFDSDSYIVSASAFADEVASALKAKYGDTKLDQGCTGYSCDSESKLQHIEDGSFWYRYEWKNSETKKLPNRISEIYLSVVHSQFNDSQVRLDYVFDNAKSCKAAADKAKASTL